MCFFAHFIFSSTKFAVDSVTSTEVSQKRIFYGQQENYKRMSRVVLVTGAAQGIGRAIALHLAKDGLNVALNDLEVNSSELQKLQQEIEQSGRKSIIITADVSVSESVEKMVREVIQQLGSLDVCLCFNLFNCFNLFFL